jgi:integrase
VVWATLCEQYAERALPHLAPATQAQWRRMIDREIVPAIGEAVASDATLCRRAVLDLLARLERRSLYSYNRALVVMRRMYNWAVGHDLVPPAPIFTGIGAMVETPRERVLSDTEAGKVLAAGYQDYPEWRAYWALLWFTGLRRGTVLAARWRDLDLDGALWTVPSEIIKGRAGQRRGTVVPLVPQLVEALRFQRAITGRHPLVLVNLRTGGAVANPQKAAARVVKASGVQDWHVHDIRHTISTGLARMRVAPHVIDAILGHASGSRVRRIYQQYDYLDERREALVKWANHLAV